jgi:predicted N-formylglutamate amidohydrolase
LTPHIVVSCEHATKRVPARYAEVLRGARRSLDTHRGWDAGALEMARALAKTAHAPLIAARATRLLVDANRSASNPGVFSEWTRGLPESERETILATYWEPHRSAVLAAVRSRRTRVAHVSVHSFTPRLKGRTRSVDIGLLYDPSRTLERALVDLWLAALRERAPHLRLRRNRPYLGISDGLTTALRTQLPPERYAGIELEISQRFTRGPAARWRILRAVIADAFREAIQTWT